MMFRGSVHSTNCLDHVMTDCGGKKKYFRAKQKGTTTTVPRHLRSFNHCSIMENLQINFK